MIIKGLFGRYERWNPVHPTHGAFWGMGVGIGCGVGWGPGFGPEVVGYVGAGCGVGFSVGITLAGFGIGLPMNFIFQAPQQGKFSELKYGLLPVGVTLSGAILTGPLSLDAYENLVHLDFDILNPVLMEIRVLFFFYLFLNQAIIATRGSALDSAHFNDFLSGKHIDGDRWSGIAHCVSHLQREATEKLSSFRQRHLLIKGKD